VSHSGQNSEQPLREQLMKTVDVPVIIYRRKQQLSGKGERDLVTREGFLFAKSFACWKPMAGIWLQREAVIANISIQRRPAASLWPANCLMKSRQER
jgi:hypothetical protein